MNLKNAWPRFFEEIESLQIQKESPRIQGLSGSGGGQHGRRLTFPEHSLCAARCAHHPHKVVGRVPPMTSSRRRGARTEWERLAPVPPSWEVTRLGACASDHHVPVRTGDTVCSAPGSLLCGLGFMRVDVRVCACVSACVCVCALVELVCVHTCSVDMCGHVRVGCACVRARALVESVCVRCTHARCLCVSMCGWGVCVYVW